MGKEAGATLFLLVRCECNSYLLHVGSQFGVRWLVDFVPINRNLDLVIELKYDNGILQISREQGQVLTPLTQILC